MIGLPSGAALFPTLQSFTTHVVTPGTTQASEELYLRFCESGYLARQERVGLSVLPKFGEFHATLSNTLAGSGDEAPGQVPIVLLSGPSIEETEFDGLVETVRAWSSSLTPSAQRAFAEKVRRNKGVDDGVPASVLSAVLPSDLLITYRRRCDYLAVIEGTRRGRRILATRAIG